jgi:hypothetical protein
VEINPKYFGPPNLIGFDWEVFNEADFQPGALKLRQEGHCLLHFAKSKNTLIRVLFFLRLKEVDNLVDQCYFSLIDHKVYLILSDLNMPGCI